MHSFIKSGELADLLMAESRELIFIHPASSLQNQTEFIQVNDYACRCLGYSRDQLMPLGFMDLLSGDEHGLLEGALRDLNQKGSAEFNLSLRTKAKKHLQCSFKSRLLDHHGQSLAVSIGRGIPPRSKTEAESPGLEYRRILEACTDGFCLLDRDGRLVDANQAAADMLGVEREELIDLCAWENDIQRDWERVARRIDHALGQETIRFETGLHRMDGGIIEVEISGYPIPRGEGRKACFIRIISEQKRIEQEREITLRLLNQLSQPSGMKELLRGITKLMRDWSGCEAVGIRLNEGPDYPYFETQGFPAQFLESEKYLCARDDKGDPILDLSGEPVLECMCGSVIAGRFDPSLPFFTKGGSFWTNSTTDLLSSTALSSQDTRIRGRCNTEGYESLALVPIRTGGQTLGLLQFNDSKRDHFDPDMISLFETLAANISMGLARRIAAEKLEISRERFALAMEATNEGLWDWDVATGAVYFSPGWLRILALDKVEGEYNDWASRLHPKDKPRVLANLAEHLEGKSEHWVQEHRIRSGDGRWKWVLGRGHVVKRDAEGKPLRMLGTMADITKQKRAHRLLQLLEYCIDNASVSIFWITPEGRFTKVNKRAARELGSSQAELVNKYVYDVDPHHTKDMRAERWRMLKENQVLTFETEHQDKYGNRNHLEVTSQYIQFEGEELEFAFVKDITDQKKEHEARKKTEERLSLALDSVSDALWDWRVDINEVYYSSRWYTMLGYEPNELPQSFETWERLLHPEDASKAATAVKEHCETGQPFEAEFRMRCKDGGWKWILARGKVVERDERGGAVRMLGTHVDITERKNAEKSLADSERRYRMLFHGANDAIFVADPDSGMILDLNQAAEELTGFSREELIGRHQSTLHPPQNGDIYQSKFQEAIDSPGKLFTEVEIIHRDGHLIPVEISSGGTLETAGQRLHVGLFRDITERRQFENNLKASEARFRDVVEMAPDPIMVHHSGSFIYVNQACLDVIGATCLEDLAHIKIWELVVNKNGTDLARKRALDLQNFGIKAPLQEFEVTGLDGRRIFLESTGRGIIYESKQCVITMWRDITERRLAEDALRDSERQRRVLARQTEHLSLAAAELLSIEDRQNFFNRISQHIVEFSDYKRVIISLFKEEPPYHDIIAYSGVDKAFVEKLGRTELPGGRYDKIFEKGYELGHLSYCIPHNVTTLLDQEGAGGGPDSGYRLFVRMNNERGEFIGVISVDESKSGLEPKEETVRPLEIFATLTSQIIMLKNEQSKRAFLEQQLLQAQKMDALGTLAGGIAHDFNNILAAIMGYSELAQEDLSLDSEVRHDISEITKAANKAKHLIRQILSFSRKIEAEMIPMSINQTVTDSAGLLERTIPKMINLDLQLDQRINNVMANPQQLEQVLMNLASNAADSILESGTITITTRNVQVQHKNCLICGEFFTGDFVLLSVKDTGSGIDPDDMPRIFDPFFTTKAIGKGTGLGLSTVFGIVGSHNGHIQCHSLVGLGTEFLIYLPVTDSETDQPGRGAPGTRESFEGSGTILVVDDEAPVREVAGKVLARSGYQVLVAGSGEEALELYRKKSAEIDGIVMDLGMPGMGGKACLPELLKINPEAKVLIASGYAQFEVSDELKALGAAAVIAKPYNRAELLSRLKEMLAGRAAQNPG